MARMSPGIMSRIYDHAGALGRMGNDHELFHEMVGLLGSDAPPLLQTLHAAWTARDLARAQRAAHTLKGLAANFGAERAVAAAAEMERLAKTQHPDGLPASIGELEAAFDELIVALASSFQTSQSS
jgi:two-component system, sensor histidine kinase and response regulator